MSTRKATTIKSSRTVAKAETKTAAKPEVMQQMSDAVEQIRDMSRQTMLAGLGAVARARRTRQEALAALVEEGLRAEPGFKQAVQELKSKLQPPAESKFDFSRFKFDLGSFDRAALQQRWEKGMADSLHRIGLTTRKEVQALARKVDKLAESIG